MGLEAFNFCARSRVTINEDVLKEFRLAFEERQRGSGSAPSVPAVADESSSELEVTAEAVDISLHRTVHYLVLQPSGVFERQQDSGVRLEDITDRAATKILFIDQHQVLDRDKRKICYDTGVIAGENTEAIARWAQYALDKNIHFFVFVLSYVGSSDRYQACRGIWDRSPALQELISGILVTFDACGEEGKALGVIKRFTDLGFSCCLIDDKAEILEEVKQHTSASGVHIKLSRKRSLDPSIADYPWAQWLSDTWTQRAVTKFLDS